LQEFQENETITLDQTENNHTVNLFGCKASTVIIKGKVNAVTLGVYAPLFSWYLLILHMLVNCTKTSVLIDSVIASISVTASPSFTIQITGIAPMIQLDTTDSGQIYLSAACLEQTEIVTAKCSAINVSIPVPGEEEGVFDEKPVPEMFRTTVKGGKLVTTIIEHTG
jgi:adenylyl cyclase-associated protein